jgi:hypothetical protein
MNQIEVGNRLSQLGEEILPKDQETIPGARLARWAGKVTGQKVHTMQGWMDALADNHLMLGTFLIELGFRLELRDDS